MQRFYLHANPAAIFSQQLTTTQNIMPYGRRQLARACLVHFDVGQYFRCASTDELDEARGIPMMRQGRWHVTASNPRPADLTFIQVNSQLSSLLPLRCQAVASILQRGTLPCHRWP